jgi:hypothetical protein
MSNFTEGDTLSDLLLAEVLPAWSRQTITLAAAAAADVPVGTALTIAGAVPAASATATAAAVLIQPIKTGDTVALVVARGAVVNKDKLIWVSGATAAQITAGLNALSALGIVPRAVL